MWDTLVASSKTAITRSKVSAPLRYLLDQDLIKGYACNWGEGRAFVDTEAMQDRTGAAVGYDPMSTKDANRWKPLDSFDTIYCGYVLNTVLAAEASYILSDVVKHLNPGGTAYFAVRTDKVEGEPYLDGVYTSRGTFQVDYTPYLPWLDVIHKTSHYAIFKIRRGS